MPDTPTFGPVPGPPDATTFVDVLPPLLSPIKPFNGQSGQQSPSTNPDSPPLNSSRREQGRPDLYPMPPGVDGAKGGLPFPPDSSPVVTVGLPVSEDKRSGARTPDPQPSSRLYNFPSTPKPATDPSHLSHSPRDPSNDIVSPRPGINPDMSPRRNRLDSTSSSAGGISSSRPVTHPAPYEAPANTRPAFNGLPASTSLSGHQNSSPSPLSLSGYQNGSPISQSFPGQSKGSPATQSSNSISHGGLDPQDDLHSANSPSYTGRSNMYSDRPQVAPDPTNNPQNPAMSFVDVNDQNRKQTDTPAKPKKEEIDEIDRKQASNRPQPSQIDVEPLVAPPNPKTDDGRSSSTLEQPGNRSEAAREFDPDAIFESTHNGTLFNRIFYIHNIRSRVLPKYEASLPHELDDELIDQLRAYLIRWQSTCKTQVYDSLYASNIDRVMESRVRSFLLRYLRYRDMDLLEASKSILQVSHWLMHEGYASLSYNYISPYLSLCGIRLITSAVQPLPNRPRLLVITNAARSFSQSTICLVVAYWLFRCKTDPSISIEFDCAQTSLATVKRMVDTTFRTFDYLALEPTDIVIANLVDRTTPNVLDALFRDPARHTPDNFWHKFGRHARIDQTTHQKACDFADFPVEVAVNEKLTSFKKLRPLYDEGCRDDIEFEAIMQVKERCEYPIDTYRAARLNMNLIHNSFHNLLEQVPYGPLFDSTTEGASSGGSQQLTDKIEGIKSCFPKWLSEVVFQELVIPENICANTTFNETQGSPRVHASGVWETYVFGKDKSGRVNICINDLNLTNFQFINFLIIWIYRDLLKAPIGQSEQINILINYHGVTLLNKKLTMILDFLNLFYNSCINKVYIFNTTFINRAVLQTAIKGSKQGGSIGYTVGDATKKIIPVVIVTEDIRSDISSQQRQYQFGLGKNRVKMSATAHMPVAHFPSH